MPKINEITFDSIVENYNKNFPKNQKIIAFQNHQYHRGICLEKTIGPISINEQEFQFISNHIAEKKYRNVLDIATGTGISALAAGIGLKALKHKGVCLSIDSYQEEIEQAQPVHSNNKTCFGQAETFKTCKNLAKLYDVQDYCRFELGIAPDCFKELIKKHFGDNKIDCVILDCPKSDEDFLNIVWPIMNFLNKKFTVFVHDVHTFANYGKIVIEKVFNKEYVNAIPSQLVFPFAMIEV